MRHFSRPQREAAESGFLATVFGKHFEPFGQLSLNAGVRLGTEGVDLVDLEGETLAIHGDSASWTFLSKGEKAFYRELGGRSYGWLEAAWPETAASPAIDFVAHLFRRGLLSINSQRAVDPDLFADGPNYNEGNLVELLVTEKCNLACPYCLAGANQSMPAMDREIAFRTIDLAFAMNETEVVAFEFAGGEPFLKFPLMREIVEHIAVHPLRGKRRVFLSIQTNATLLNEEKVQWLKNNDIRVGISLDGGTQAQNSSRPQVNGKESFTKLQRGIDLLKRMEVPFGGLVVLNRSNVGSAAALARFMLENGIHGFRVNPVAFLGDARRNWERVGLSQDEIITFFKDLLAVIVGQRLMILEDNVHSMCDFLTSKQRRTRCMRSACGAGDTFQSIAANGDIYPCGRATQSPGLKLGNVFDEGVESLSAPARGNVAIAQIRERHPDMFDDCRVCAYRQLCQSGCSAQAWERYGTVRHKTPECAFYKSLYPYLMRWLSFDADAFDHLNAMSYFNNEGVRFDHDFTASQPLAAAARAVR